MAVDLHSKRSGTLIVQRNGTETTVRGDPYCTLGHTCGTPDGVSAEGVWVRWRWDGNRLTVENDRFGFLPVYFAQLDDGFAISTELPELLNAGVDDALDDCAIAVFIRLGYYVGDDTPFQKIRCLPPGSRLNWDDTGLSVKSSAPDLPSSTSTLSRDAAIDEYGNRFQLAVERMLPETDLTMCCPLSGGRDSRHILYALLRSGRVPDVVYTAKARPPRADSDVEIASRIVRHLGLTHEVIYQPGNGYSDEFAKNQLTGFCSDEHTQMMPIIRWQNRIGCDVTWDGIAGDIFSCGAYDNRGIADNYAQGRCRVLAETLLAGEGYLPQSLTPEYLNRWNRALAVERLCEELDRYVDLPNPIAAFFFFNRVRRELALSPFSMLTKSSHVLAPFLSHDVFDLLINLPLEFFRGRQFHSEAIERFYPELPSAPFVSASDNDVHGSRLDGVRFSLGLMKTMFSLPQRELIVRPAFLLPRLMKAMVSAHYGTHAPILFARQIVLLQLQQFLSRKAVRPTACA